MLVKNNEKKHSDLDVELCVNLEPAIVLPPGEVGIAEELKYRVHKRRGEDVSCHIGQQYAAAAAQRNNIFHIVSNKKRENFT